MLVLGALAEDIKMAHGFSLNWGEWEDPSRNPNQGLVFERKYNEVTAEETRRKLLVLDKRFGVDAKKRDNLIRLLVESDGVCASRKAIERVIKESVGFDCIEYIGALHEAGLVFVNNDDVFVTSPLAHYGAKMGMNVFWTDSTGCRRNMGNCIGKYPQKT